MTPVSILNNDKERITALLGRTSTPYYPLIPSPSVPQEVRVTNCGRIFSPLRQLRGRHHSHVALC